MEVSSEAEVLGSGPQSFSGTVYYLEASRQTVCEAKRLDSFFFVFFAVFP